MKRRLLPAAVTVTALALTACAAALFCAAQLPTPLAQPEPGAVFENVTLVVPGEGRQAQRTVIVREGRIEVVAPAAPGAEPGGFLLPGLVDAHAHFPSALLPGERRLAAFLFLAHGVTTVRSPGSREKPGQRAQPAGPDSAPGPPGPHAAPGPPGAYPGPRVVPCSPIIDGELSTQREARIVHGDAEARAAVEQFHEAGFACISVGLELDKDALDAVRSAAAQRSLPLVGPVPRRVHWDDAGLDDAQQLHGFALKEVGDALPAHEPLWRRDFLALDREHIFERAGAASWNNMAVTPILVMHQRLLNALHAGDANNFGDASHAGNTGDARSAGDANDASHAGNTGDADDARSAGNTGDAGDFGDAGDARSAGDANNAGDFGDARDAVDASNVGDAGDARAVIAARLPPELELLPPWRRVWARPFLRIDDTGPNPLRISRADQGWLKSAQRRMFDVVLQLHNSGIPVHTGSNAGAPGLVPGAALHRELALLQKAGLTPEQVLAASMVASARAMGVPRLGELSPGAPADLLLFRDDPTQSLEHLATLEAVVSGGLLYTKEALAAGIRAYQERYQEFGPRSLARGVRGFMRLRSSARAATHRSAEPEAEAHNDGDADRAHPDPDMH